jgi:hypothetical protein
LSAKLYRNNLQTLCPESPDKELQNDTTTSVILPKLMRAPRRVSPTRLRVNLWHKAAFSIGA